MKFPELFFITLISLGISSCTGQNNSNNSTEESPYFQNNKNANPSGEANNQTATMMNKGSNLHTSNSSQSSGKIVMHAIMDPKTKSPFSHIPLPANWKIQSTAATGSPSIVGPGIEIYSYPYQTFMYSNDPMTQQAYQYAGQQMRQPAGIENVISQDLMQWAQGNGLQFKKQYGLPKVAQANKSYMDQLYTYGAQQNSFQAAGTEWIDNKGKKVLIVINYNENRSQGFVMWGYYVQLLKSDAAGFDEARDYYLNGLINTQYNQQHIQAYNQQEASKLQGSAAAHNQKMQNNQANFEAQQRLHRSTYDAVNKSSMDAYNNRMESMDRNQHNTINTIREENTVTNPSNGQQYQVEGHSNQYWMNSEGEYIPSNNSLYDPNLDPAVNGQSWEEAPVSPY